MEIMQKGHRIAKTFEDKMIDAKRQGLGLPKLAARLAPIPPRLSPVAALKTTTSLTGVDVAVRRFS